LHPFAQLIGEFEESEVVDALDADPFRQKFGGSNQCRSHQSILLSLSFLDFIIGKSRGACKSDFTDRTLWVQVEIEPFLAQQKSPSEVTRGL
jgi:hypothetical protein